MIGLAMLIARQSWELHLTFAFGSLGIGLLAIMTGLHSSVEKQKCTTHL